MGPVHKSNSLGESTCTLWPSHASHTKLSSVATGNYQHQSNLQTTQPWQERVAMPQVLKTPISWHWDHTIQNEQDIESVASLTKNNAIGVAKP